MKRQSTNVRKLTIIAMLGAITVVLALTPLGFIPIGPLNATTMHIPVIVAGVLEGPIAGAAVGLIFGCSSLFNHIVRPTPLSPIFYNPLISILPRVLIGLIASALYSRLRGKSSVTMKGLVVALFVVLIGFLSWQGWRSFGEHGWAVRTIVPIVLAVFAIVLIPLSLKKLERNPAVILTAFLTTLAHTVMVMGGIYFLYAEKYLSVMAPGASLSLARNIIFGVILTSGLPEAMVASLVTVGVVGALHKANGQGKELSEKQVESEKR